MDINETFRSLNAGLPEDILRRKLYGDLDGAVRLIDRRLARPDTPQALRNCMIAQRELMLRTPPDYPFTRAGALARVRERIPDFTEAEFDQRVDDGGIGWIYLRGEPHYFKRFFETMCKTDDEIARRASHAEDKEDGGGEENALSRCRRRMQEEGSMSLRIRIRAAIRMKDELFTPGMFVRAHLPLPAACEQQSGITIEEITPNGAIAPETAPQRTVCWEGTWEESPRFSVVYSYIHTEQYHDLTAPGTKPLLSAAELAPFLEEEAPHIIFSPYIRSLANELTGGTENPLEKARRIYDFITMNMNYTFMPAYFILESIAENCARNFTGDCGVFALLFITLCRCAGVPAQWQSGLTAGPKDCGCHDWARFYAPGFGWLYADPSYGIAAHREGDEARRQFYFGNLDPCRMVANNRFQAPFTVEKAHWRADPYDNQVGELETADRGLRGGEFRAVEELLLCEEL